MSATHAGHDQHAHLRQLATSDPTRTGGLRDRFRRDMVGRFRDIRGAIRRVVGYDEDYFRLRQDARLADRSPDRALTRRERRRHFREWLRQQFRDGLLEGVTEREAQAGQHWTATYIRAAYGRGWEAARERLRQRGVSVNERSIDAVFNMGVPARQLRQLYVRVYRLVRDIAVDAPNRVAPIVAAGLAEGINPKEMARRITEEVRTIQHTRAETLARTEVIRSYADATLDRYEEARVNGVTVSGEFTTAGDERVCPICEALEGEVFGIDAMRTETFDFTPSESEPDHLAGEYPVKPPVHPRCRCAILPVVN